jgi:hypothetical protein
VTHKGIDVRDGESSRRAPRSRLGDVLVHGNDALRALGLEFGVDPDDAVPVLNAYRRVGGLIFHARPYGTVMLVATDVQWSCGMGPEVKGRAIDLVMFMANRQQIVETTLRAGRGGRGHITGTGAVRDVPKPGPF